MSLILKMKSGKHLEIFDAKNPDLKIETDIPLPNEERRALCPVDVLLGALAGCMSSSIISVCNKKGKISSYEAIIDVAYDDDKKIKEIDILYKIGGENIKGEMIEHAIKLGREKYCTVSFAINPSIKLDFKYEII